ncbi:hypothetical protein TNIN_301641 [Trichonephila inaurata madagascariensis]|uniref:Uncharacterized protein n=1 Tax=Trichonephila inaurata madagascariensis TaxID=2747483 RepID=A0A8X6YU69_9ARAC|nr:hypothetical protein TNIN_301641 [Trichonephila inaurata madagascariensis]
MARFKIPDVVLTLTTLTRPSLPGNTSRIRPIGLGQGLGVGILQKNELILPQGRLLYTPLSTSLKMSEIFCAPTVLELISQGLNEFSSGMIE